MSNVKEVSKTLTLDLKNIPEDRVASAKQDVGDFIIEEILRSVGDGKSPVKGESWKKLSQAYADEFKGGDTTPTMQLFGDLLDSLKSDDGGGSKIIIGHLDAGQAPKADGHNQLSLEAELWAGKTGFPKRRYIPAKDQKFNSLIENGIKDILDSYRERPDGRNADRFEAGNIDNVEQGLDDNTGEIVSVDVGDLFSDDVIEQLIRDVQKRRR